MLGHFVPKLPHVQVEVSLARLDARLPVVKLLADLGDLATEDPGDLIKPGKTFSILLDEAISQGLQRTVLHEIPLRLELLDDAPDVLSLFSEPCVGLVELLRDVGIDSAGELIKARADLRLALLELDTEVGRHACLHDANAGGNKLLDPCLGRWSIGRHVL